MKRIRLLGCMFIALVALGALASASAFAELPEILPVPTGANPAKFTASGGEAILLGKSVAEPLHKIICKNFTMKGEFTSQDAGKLTVDCTGVISSGLQCNSTGDAAGIVLFEGAMQLVDVLPTGTLDLGIWIEPKAVPSSSGDLKFTCGGILTITVLGSLIGVIDNAKGELLLPDAKGKEFKALWKEKAHGEQEIKECMSLKALCEKGPFDLTSDLGSGEELSAEIADASLLFEKEVEIHF